MTTKRARRVGALIIGVTMLAAACGGDDDGASDTTAPAETSAPEAETSAPESETTAPGAETTAPSGGGECGFAQSDVTDGDLDTFAGTTPFGKLTDEFLNRLCEVDPNLTDLNYATETYDAVIITALAVEVAKTDGIEYASEIVGVTRDGEKCTTYADCLALVQAGTDIDYDGASGPLTMAGNGEPIVASYGLLTMGPNNRIDPTLTEYIEVEGPASADVPLTPVEGTRAGDGVLKIGTILPQTGSLAFLGPPEFAGFDLAINEINDAGGALGVPVEGIKGDSGDATTDTASRTVDRLLSESVDSIIGAASSGVSLTVIDTITGAGVVHFSPANTSPELSTYPDKGLYFRTAPPDVYQGNVLGQFVVGDGNSTVAFISRNDSYGTGLTEEATRAIEEGGGSVVVTKYYDEGATSFDAEIDEIVAADPDAIVVIGFEESSKILRTMVEKGVGPKVKRIYGCDGNIGNALGETYDAGE